MLIDTVKIHQIQQLSNTIHEDLLGELILLFRRTSQVDMNELVSETEKKNWMEVSKTAHRLKSSCSMLGIKPATQICLEIETVSKKNDSMFFDYEEKISMLKSLIGTAICEIEILWESYSRKTIDSLKPKDSKAA